MSVIAVKQYTVECGKW